MQNKISNKKLTTVVTAFVFMFGVGATAAFVYNSPVVASAAGVAEETVLDSKEEEASRDKRHHCHEKRGLKNSEMKERHEAVKETLENNDYQAFLDATQDVSKYEDREISEEDFSKLVEVHNLKEEGKHDEAKQIMKDLGLKGPGHERGPKSFRGEMLEKK